MSLLDFDAFEQAPMQHDPCDFIVVPGFVKSAALDAINRDYPTITEPGNFPPEDLVYGAAFEALLDELGSPAVKQHFARKFDMDLSGYPLELTVRKYAEQSDGNIHNDAAWKKLTVLIYFNKEWHAAGGQLRMLRNLEDMENYAVEVPPLDGTMIAFRRNESSFHGFPEFVGERRSVQFYWVTPERAARKPKKIKQLRRWVKDLTGGLAR